MIFKNVITKFTKDQKGVSAVEFALVVPILLTIYLGSVEVYQAYSANRKITLAASAATDLVARFSNGQINTTSINNIFTAAEKIIAPFDTAPFTIIISEIKRTGSQTKVKWSRSNNGAGHASGTKIELPDGLIPIGTKDSVIMTQVSYSYQPLMTYIWKKPFTMSDVFYERPATTITATF